MSEVELEVLLQSRTNGLKRERAGASLAVSHARRDICHRIHHALCMCIGPRIVQMCSGFTHVILSTARSVPPAIAWGKDRGAYYLRPFSQL